MSSFTIVHDIPGRMRIRYGKNKFSSVQGEVLKKDLYAWPMIESVEVINVTGSVLMSYDKAQKGLLLNKLKNLDIQYLQNADTSSRLLVNVISLNVFTNGTWQCDYDL